MPFTSLKLSLALQKALNESGFKKPTVIQEKVIPLLFEGRDIMARAQTGSGKTASFVLPILEILESKKSLAKAKIKVLILTPTRELTLQVAEAFRIFSRFLSKKPKVVSLIGGEGIGNQLYDIQQGCDIVVATSGRLLDVISKKQMNLSYLEFFILDEADKMLDLGFEEELALILPELPQERQNLLFSATYPPKMLSIASKITDHPVEISIENEEPIVSDIAQRVILLDKEKRSPLLRELIKSEKLGQVLVFMANKRASDNIAQKFRRYGFLAESFHGDLDQEERNQTLDDFKTKKINILFATDLVSRGLHIDDVSCVVNFDLPRSPTDYIHRIGRTGRAGRSGVAISFISYEDENHFRLIEKRASIKLPRESIKGFEISGEVPKKVKGPAPIKGKKKSKKDKLREKAQNKTH